MPNRRRNDPKHAPQHVMFHAVEGVELFYDDLDRSHMLDLLRDASASLDVKLPAWSLMPNHVHLMTIRGRVPLGRVMQSIESPYMSYFNKKYGRRGPKVLGRYLSKRVPEIAYFKRVIPYILANPLVAGIVKSVSELRTYAWTSWRDFCRGEGGFTDDELLVTVFGDGDRGRAKTEIARRLRASKRNASALDEDLLRQDREEDIPLALVVKPSEVIEELSELGLADSASLDDVVRTVCRVRDVDAAKVIRASGARTSTRARDEIAHLAATKLGIPRVEIAAKLNVSCAAVTYAIARAETTAVRRSKK